MGKARVRGEGEESEGRRGERSRAVCGALEGKKTTRSLPSPDHSHSSAGRGHGQGQGQGQGLRLCPTYTKRGDADVRAHVRERGRPRGARPTTINPRGPLHGGPRPVSFGGAVGGLVPRMLFRQCCITSAPSGEGEGQAQALPRRGAGLDCGDSGRLAFLLALACVRSFSPLRLFSRAPTQSLGWEITSEALPAAM